MVNWLRPNSRWSCVLWVIGTYVIAADLLPNLILVVVNSIGYLPYSDRPGPGWQPAHLPSKDELQFFLGFSLMLLKPTAFYAAIFAGAAWIMGFCRLPLWGVRVLATPIAFLSAGIMMAAAGWMIAISPLGIYTAAACGAFWGLIVFPRLVPRSGYVLPMAARIALPIILLAAGAYWLVRPLLPNPALTNAKIEVIRHVDADVPVPQLDLSYLGPSAAAKTKGLENYVSVTRMEFATDGRNQLRVLLIVDDAQPVAKTFLLPRTGDAIYRQSHGVWKEERSEGRRSDLSVELTPTSPTEVNLQTKGPCCSSMAESFAPYDRH